jgi:hypothetical protein
MVGVGDGTGLEDCSGVPVGAIEGMAVVRGAVAEGGAAEAMGEGSSACGEQAGIAKRRMDRTASKAIRLIFIAPSLLSGVAPVQLHYEI